MPEKDKEENIAPYLFGLVGGASGFACGMKLDDLLIEKSLSRIQDPESKMRLIRKIALEKSNTDYPFISRKLRSHLMNITGDGNDLLSKVRTPLGLCMIGGISCYLGATVLANAFVKDREIGR